MEDEVVAILHLREEQTMLTARLFAFLIGDKRCKCGEPLLAAREKIPGGQRVGQFLQSRRVAALEERIGGWLEINPFFPHPSRQPVMLVEADPRGKRKVVDTCVRTSVPSAHRSGRS